MRSRKQSQYFFNITCLHNCIKISLHHRSNVLKNGLLLNILGRIVFSKLYRKISFYTIHDNGKPCEIFTHAAPCYRLRAYTVSWYFYLILKQNFQQFWSSLICHRYHLPLAAFQSLLKIIYVFVEINHSFNCLTMWRFTCTRNEIQKQVRIKMVWIKDLVFTYQYADSQFNCITCRFFIIFGMLVLSVCQSHKITVTSKRKIDIFSIQSVF